MNPSQPAPDRLIFQFQIRFDPSAVPSGSADRLREKMRRWFIENGLDYGFGALGGMAVVYGDVGRPRDHATLGDRDNLAAWLKRQRLKCRIGLGNLEPESQSDITREVTELVFEIDNLTDEDWREGEDYRRQLEREIKREGI